MPHNNPISQAQQIENVRRRRNVTPEQATQQFNQFQNDPGFQQFLQNPEPPPLGPTFQGRINGSLPQPSAPPPTVAPPVFQPPPPIAPPIVQPLGNANPPVQPGNAPPFGGTPPGQGQPQIPGLQAQPQFQPQQFQQQQQFGGPQQIIMRARHSSVPSSTDSTPWTVT